MKHVNERQYHAVFNPAVEGGYDVSFPDFPGCVTFGKTFEEAQQMAKEALELWIEELKARGEDIPQGTPRSLVAEIQVVIPKTLSRNATTTR